MKTKKQMLAAIQDLKAISGRPRPNLANMFIRIFYIDTLNSRTQDPYFVEEE